MIEELLQRLPAYIDFHGQRCFLHVGATIDKKWWTAGYIHWESGECPAPYYAQAETVEKALLELESVLRVANLLNCVKYNVTE